jgi:hypothetical protein
MLKMADYFREGPETAKGSRQAQVEGYQRPQAEGAIDELTAKNEREILQNVDINFLFSKGYELGSSLIDMNRVYLVVDKIKELARRQAIDGSTDINYEELVSFLRDLDDDNQ